MSGAAVSSRSEVPGVTDSCEALRCETVEAVEAGEQKVAASSRALGVRLAGPAEGSPACCRVSTRRTVASHWAAHQGVIRERSIPGAAAC